MTLEVVQKEKGISNLLIFYMAKFAQYYLKYDLTSLFAGEYRSSRQQLFGALFETNESIEFSTGEGNDKKVYKHQVHHLSMNENIIVMRIANDKPKTVEQDFKEISVRNEPSCYVIIDNREGCRRVAVQKNRKAFDQPKHVCNIITESVNKRLQAESFIGIELYPQYYTRDFYKAWQIHEHHTQRLRFNLCENDLPEGFSEKEMDDNTIAGFIIKANEESQNKKYRTILELNPPENVQYLFVDRESAYIRNLVKFSANTGNRIEIVTSDGATFTCYIDDDSQSDSIYTNDFDANLLDELFEKSPEELENVEMQILEYVNGMKYIVDNDEKHDNDEEEDAA